MSVSTSQITVENPQGTPECFILKGRLNRETIPSFWPNSLQQLKNATSSQKPLILDFGHVDHIDTAGLAWLINLIRDARGQNIQFSVVNPPETLLNLAKISDVDGFLPLQ
ncbi:STAS domain-containing protein [Paraglaciecola polaris]|uniref:Anti-sigma-factor antagonist n=1 Tax=Paraglaciecola polaris LMG 21857 TaxID=1129793 RepID=K7AJU3_9ALTE|nr:STAS domain-containing protein [Paraglaciecola polaris]GAC35635.1 anti-sigma-factor antagonist [Paraglaciecola polaris LMG 21857]